MKLLITGGAGFIGSNFILSMINSHPEVEIINLDVLTYAGNLNNLKSVDKNPRYTFIRGDICDLNNVNLILDKYRVDTIVHFAAESHVDRSITKASEFVRTNVLGTQNLLECARQHQIEKFIHISTDEVYGSTITGSFTENNILSPSSPYSASKAGSDLLALSYFTTYKLPVIITRCTNNFGPCQHPEKLIPLFVTNLLEGRKVPVYGTGKNVRDWIHVSDHCQAVEFLIKKGKFGEIYNIGGGNEMTNIEITNHRGRGIHWEQFYSLHERPAIVINAAAYTDVDGCEDNREYAFSVNGIGPGNIAKACIEIDAMLVHFSTDYIFDGTKTEYREDDRPNPINAYGESKLLGEVSIAKNLENYRIIRTSWMYGSHGKNFVDTILTLSQQIPVVRVVNDQVGKPTYNVDLANKVPEIISCNPGMYHITNDGQCSWYEFACAFIPNAAPCSTDEFPRKAKRPAYSVLANTKTLPLRHWKEAVKEYIQTKKRS